jgi:hypothetical protein
VATRHREPRQEGDRLHSQAGVARHRDRGPQPVYHCRCQHAGFTINLSANNPAEADALADLEIGSVVTILAHDYARRAVRHRAKARPDEWAETIAQWRDRIALLPVRTPAGRRIAICPATYTAATCKSCGACAEPRDAVIGFPAHGPWRMVEKATAAREVAVGESWAFRGHRTMAEVIAQEKSPTA